MNQLQQQMNSFYNDHMGASTCTTAYTSCVAPYTAPLRPGGIVEAKPSTPFNFPEKKSMFKEIQADIKAFILEHRGVIYFIAFALILDHFIFRGAFKARLQSMAEKVVTKVEEKIK